ncbi:MAG: protein containing YHS domain protein, partial [Chloroflexota bacterium]|nr:protein containing YHS domain protein [Chloroflexota bacterium]
MALTVEVMGSASPQHDAEAWDRMAELGRAVAGRGCTLLAGACPGLPYAAVQGVKAASGLVVGISS